mgnify:FL=1
MANVPVRQFLGTTTTTCINTTTDIASGNFSSAPAATYDNTTDATLPYAPFAKCMLEMPDWGAAPVAGTVVGLWGVLKDTDGTDDDTDAPSGSASNGARWFGNFLVSGVDALQRRTIVINMVGVEKVNFYVYNGTAQNMNNDGGTSCVPKGTPLAVGVVA